jgi:hypothetical protein
MDEIYRTKAGVCRHGAYFTLETIERGARSAELLAINYRARDGKTGWHAIVTENDNVGVWIVMNFDYDGAKPITGPFRSNDEAVKRIVKDFGGSLITWRAEDATIGYHQ